MSVAAQAIPTTSTTADGVEARLTPPRLGVFGLQHVLIMYAGAVAVPLIVGGALGLNRETIGHLVSADLLACGIATLIQSWGLTRWVGIRLPLIQGASFTAIAPMIAAGTGHGLTAMYGAILVAGAFGIVIAPVLAAARSYFPPLVTGVTMVIVGVALIRSGVGLIAGQDPAAADYAAFENLAVAAAVLLVILLVARFTHGFASQVAVLIGLVAGTCLAIPLGMTDFSSVGDAAVVGFVDPFTFGLPSFEVATIIPMMVAMVVILVESSAYMLAVGETIGRRVTSADLTRGMRTDGVGTIVGGVLNAFPSTTFSQNVGLVGITGVRSRFVTTTAGGILVLLGLLPVLGQIVANIPGPVVGAAAMVLFAMVSAVGIKTLRGVDYEDSGNVLVIAVALVAGMIPVASPTFYQSLPDDLAVVVGSSITATLLAAFVLNLVFNQPWRGGSRPSRSSPDEQAREAQHEQRVPVTP